LVIQEFSKGKGYVFDHALDYRIIGTVLGKIVKPVKHENIYFFDPVSR